LHGAALEADLNQWGAHAAQSSKMIRPTVQPLARASVLLSDLEDDPAHWGCHLSLLPWCQLEGLS
jgi:predicted component of type VI protein secretion system